VGAGGETASSVGRASGPLRRDRRPAAQCQPRGHLIEPVQSEAREASNAVVGSLEECGVLFRRPRCETARMVARPPPVLTLNPLPRGRGAKLRRLRAARSPAELEREGPCPEIGSAKRSMGCGGSRSPLTEGGSAPETGVRAIGPPHLLPLTPLQFPPMTVLPRIRRIARWPPSARPPQQKRKVLWD
jgi:hypothetical protein